jgi:hypothetical protein
MLPLPLYVMVKGMPKLEDRAKTIASQESILLPEILINHLQKFATSEAPDDYLFPAKNGKPINPNSFRQHLEGIERSWT